MKLIDFLKPVVLTVLLIGLYFCAPGQTVTFNFTGAPQSYTVPEGYYSLVIDAQGAIGGAGLAARGGYGGRVQCTLAVTPGQVLNIFTGDSGRSYSGCCTGVISPGGYNGGGNGANNGGGGGGATDIRLGGTTLSCRVIVAGGGGGGGYYSVLTDYERGGNGGNLTGEQGYWNSSNTFGGGGGTQTSGGNGDTYSLSGTDGLAGIGGNSSVFTSGGGGGGGYFGGGGGSSDGGGGGSSFTNSIFNTNITLTQGYNTSGQGTVNITPICNPPVGGLITGSDSLCAGGSVLFTNPSGSVGGLWSVSNSAVAMAGSATGIITGVSPGTLIITYSVNYICGSASATKIIKVLPAVAPISGPAADCISGTISLNDPTSGGVWTSSNAVVASINTSGLLMGHVAGTTIVSYTLGSGCQSVFSINIISALPAVSGSSRICTGSPVALSDSVSGGVWTSNNTAVAIAGSISGVVSGITPGSALITYSLGSGCAPVTFLVDVAATPAAITGPSAICAGNIDYLFDPTSGGAWTSNNSAVASIGSISGLLTGINPGNASLSYTLSTGCSAILSLTVNPLPAAILGNTSFCINSTTNLSDSVSGGSWNSSSSIVSVNAISGIVLGVSHGNAVITYSLPSGCKALSTVTVNPLPNPVTGSPFVCNGGTSVLTDATPGGTWTSSNPTIAIIGSGSGIVSGLVNGATTISYSLNTGCPAVFGLTVNPVPASVTGSSGFCNGSSVNLSSGTSGGIWISGNTSIATAGSTSGVITGISPGTLVISYLLPTGCFSTKTETVYSTPGPIAGVLSVCTGASLTLGDALPGGTWSSSNPGIINIGSISGIATGVSIGTAIITYNAAGGCQATGMVTDNPVPIPITGPSLVCQGANITLNDVLTGGSWFSNNLSVASIDEITGVISGVSAGSATITYKMSTGCSAMVGETVLPQPPSISGPGNVCQGAAINLSEGISGGFWSASNSSVSIGSVSGNLTGVSPGSSYVTYTFPSTGCYKTRPITVNPLPSAISGFTTLCAGSTATLSEIGTGTWASNNLTVASIGYSSGIVTGISSGTAIITFTLVTGCQAYADINVLSQPGTYSITGGGGYCSGGIGVPIGLSGSSLGINYQLYMSGTVTGLPVAGNGLSINLGLKTTAGNYTIIAINPSTGCMTQMPGAATITINPLPGIFTVTGGGSYCSGGIGINIGLDYATSGINYNLYRNDTLTSTMTGIGSTLDFGLLTAAGTYTVSAVNPVSGCISPMAGSSNISILPSPLPVSGTTTVCSGAISGLLDSTPGGNWSSSNAAVASIGIHTGVLTGVYAGSSILSYTLSNGCAATATAIVNETPAVFTVTGGGFYCSGGVGVPVGLSTSVTGFNYMLYHGGVPTGTSITGTGGFLNFGLQTSGGNYTVEATNALTGCVSNMAGIANVNINLLPDPYPVTGGGSFCSGGTGVHVGLSGSNSGISYQLFLGGVVADSLSGFGGALDFGIQANPGVYTVVATNTITGCVNNMTGNALVIVNPTVIPSVSITSMPGDTICYGIADSFTAIPVNGGTSPVYIWKINGVPVSTSGAGYVYMPVNGDRVSVSMTSNATCAMPGSVNGNLIMVVDSLPTPISGNLSVCVGATTVLTTASSGGTWNSMSPLVASIATIGATPGEVTGLSAGTSVITYGFSTGCKVSVTVTVQALPLIGISSVPAGCGGIYSLSATGGNTYSWSPAIGLSCNSCSVTKARPDGNTRYIVTGTDLVSGCTDTSGISLAGNYISGYINYGVTIPDTLDTKVWLIQFNSSDSSLIALDSTTSCINGGLPYYEFANKPAGNYMVKAKLIHGAQPGSSGYIPTYSLSTPHWYSALSVSHNQLLDTLHINMLYGIVPAGNGFIGGLISSGAGRGTSTDVPAPGILVFLENSAGETISYTYTDSLGKYSFSNIANGSYMIYPEEYQYRTVVSAIINLNAANDSATKIDFKEFTESKVITPTSVTDVQPIAASEGLSVYPNPASGVLNIQWENKASQNATIVITDITGRLVSQYSFDLFQSNGKTQVDLSGISDGLYLITVKGNDLYYSAKLVVEK